MSAPVLLITGDDHLLVDRALERVLTELRAAEDDLDVSVHDASETTQLPELRTASLFGGRACAILRGCEGLAGDLKRDVETYLEAPDPGAILVLTAVGTQRIPKVVKLATEHGERTEVKRPADWDDRGWDRLVREELARLGRDAEVAAVAAIRAHAGSDPSAIASKVAQVAAATGTKDRITAVAVEQVVEGHGRQSGFAVADAVAARDPAAALVALRGALSAGEEPLALLGAVVFRVRQLLQVRGGVSAKEAGLSPGQHRRLEGLARRFNPGELAWVHDRLAATDVDLKGSELPAPIVLELALLDVATSQQVGAPFNPLAASG